MPSKSSKLSGFHDLDRERRMEEVARFSDLNEEEKSIINGKTAVDMSIMEHLIENVISTVELPVGIATNFQINGKDYLIPMAVEEASIVAACSNAARIARAAGGFQSSAGEPMMIGQIQVINYGDFKEASRLLMGHQKEIIEVANSKSSTLKKLGAGVKGIEIRRLDDPDHSMVIHLNVDVRDAMGANAVNTMCEAVSTLIQEITGGEVNLRILSNLTPQRLAVSRAVFPADMIGGERVVRRIISAYQMANVDPFRAATHNKGIMNGIDSVLMVTMNDWRAAEANAHTYSHLTGELSLTRYWKNENGDLVGEIEIPISVGVVGGTTNAVPKARVFKKILGVSSSMEFASVLAAVGLAQNFAALRALCSEGIQKGHMALHARNLAVTAGAIGHEADEVARLLAESGTVNITSAKEILQKLRNAYNSKINQGGET